MHIKSDATEEFQPLESLITVDYHPKMTKKDRAQRILRSGKVMISQRYGEAPTSRQQRLREGGKEGLQGPRQCTAYCQHGRQTTFCHGAEWLRRERIKVRDPNQESDPPIRARVKHGNTVPNRIHVADGRSSSGGLSLCMIGFWVDDGVEIRAVLAPTLPIRTAHDVRLT